MDANLELKKEPEEISEILVTAAARLNAYVVQLDLTLAQMKDEKETQEMPDRDPHLSQLAVLGEQAAELRAEVELLRKESKDAKDDVAKAKTTVGEVETKADKFRSNLRITTAFIFLLVITCGILIWAVTQNRELIDRVNALSQEGICVYNEAFLKSYSPEAAARYPGGIQEYENLFEKMRLIERKQCFR